MDFTSTLLIITELRNIRFEKFGTE
jgi:hypothetical protein